MYANLLVTLANGERIRAWKVDVLAGVVTVHKDAQDGTGSYAEPDGERHIPLTKDTPEITILADF